MAPFASPVVAHIDTDGDDYVSDMTGTNEAGTDEQTAMGSAAVTAGYLYTAWWQYTPLTTGELHVTFAPSATDEPMTAGSYMYSGGPTLAGLTRIGSTLPSEVHNYALTGGVTYWIQGATTEPDATLLGVFTGPASAEYGPIVVLDPFDKTVADGANVTFKSLGAGRPTPTLQWQWHASEGA